MTPRHPSTRKYERILVCLPPGMEAGQYGDIVETAGLIEKSQFLREMIRQARELGLPDFRPDSKRMVLARIPDKLASEIDRARGRVSFDNYLVQLLEKALQEQES